MNRRNECNLQVVNLKARVGWTLGCSIFKRAAGISLELRLLKSEVLHEKKVRLCLIEAIVILGSCFSYLIFFLLKKINSIEKERERNIDVREKHRLIASCTQQAGDQT